MDETDVVITNEVRDVKINSPKKRENIINFYKINLKKGVNAINYTNIIFYDNQNKTLPLGQDLSTKILVETSNLKLKLKEKSEFKIVTVEDDNISKPNIKTVNLLEYDIEQ